MTLQIYLQYSFTLLGFGWEFIREWNAMIIRVWKRIKWNGMYLSKGMEWKRIEWNGIK